MKHRYILYLVSWLFFSVAGFFTACSDEEPLTPSGNDANGFAPAAGDHSAEAKLRNAFYGETGVYLLFNDTLRHVQSGIGANGQPQYVTELVDLSYNLTGDSYYTLRLKRYYDFEDMEAATNLFKSFIYTHLGPSIKPYSVLLLHTLEMDDGYGDGFQPINYLSNFYCLGIALGDVTNLTETDKMNLARSVLKEIVADAIEDLDYDDYKGAFAAVTEDDIYEFMGDLIPGWDRTQLEELYELGFMSYEEGWLGDDPYYDSPLAEWDDMFSLVMDTPWDELEAQWGKYEKIMQQLEIVRDAISATGYQF